MSIWNVCKYQVVEVVCVIINVVSDTITSHHMLLILLHHVSHAYQSYIQIVLQVSYTRSNNNKRDAQLGGSYYNIC